MKKDCTNTETFLNELKRMFLSRDDKATLRVDMTRFDGGEIMRIIKWVQKWSDSHPEKTYLEDFLEKFPDAKVTRDTESVTLICGVCQQNVYGTDQDCLKMDCRECWNTVKGETPKSGRRKKL